MISVHTTKMKRFFHHRVLPILRYDLSFRTRLLLVCTSVFFVCSSSTSALAEDSIVWLPYPEDGITLGQGFDLLSNRKTSGVCVQFVPVEDGGLETSYFLSTLNSFSDVLSSMNISASGALDMSTVLTASMQLGFANRIRTTKTNDKFLFNANIQRGALYTSPQRSSKLGARHPFEEGTSIDQEATVDFRDDLPNSRLDMVTQCGHGFVSAIVSGVQLNTAIDTSTVDSKTASTFSGSLKLDVLGGLITGSGSVEGESEEKNVLNKSSITSYIKGGERYSLPRDIPELGEFVHNLPTLATEQPRPIKIAITPYSALSARGDAANVSVLADASTLRPLVYAYFAVREARHRIAELLDDWGAIEERRLFVIPGKLKLFQEMHELTLLMSRTQELLRFCQSEFSKQNINAAIIASQKVRSATSRRVGEQEGEIQLIYQELENQAREKKNEATARGGLFCENDQGIEDLRTRVANRYFFSLVSMPIALQDIRDPLVESNDFEEYVKSLLNGENEISLQIGKLESTIRDKRRACESQYDSTLEKLYRRHNDLPWEQEINTGRRADLRNTIENITREKEAECSEAVQSEKRQLAELNAEMDKVRKDPPLGSEKLAIVRDVLGREVYKRRFYPLLKSMCEIDIQYDICTYSYEQVMLKISEHIFLTKRELREIDRILAANG